MTGTLENRVLELLLHRPIGKVEISLGLGQNKVSGQLNKVIRQMIVDKTIELTIPDKPASRLQKYQITQRGRALLDNDNMEAD